MSRKPRHIERRLQQNGNRKSQRLPIIHRDHRYRLIAEKRRKWPTAGHIVSIAAIGATPLVDIWQTRGRN